MNKKHLVILSGAGISKESGIDTFRDKDGLWKKHDALKLASIEGWNTDPQAVLDFYNARRRQLMEVQPNKAHELLAALEEWYDVSIITQNVDDLHERAGSSRVIHLHGELSKVCLSIDKENADCIELRPLNNDIHLGDKAKDGSQLRPYIVWFGEPVPNMPLAMNTAFEADIFVVIGTSLLVSPAIPLQHVLAQAITLLLILERLRYQKGPFTSRKQQLLEWKCFINRW